MAIDYKALRTTLDSGSMTLFRNQLSNQITTSLLSGGLISAVTAYNSNTSLSLDQRTKAIQTAIDRGSADFGNINKYVTTDSSYQNVMKNLAHNLASTVKAAGQAYTSSDISKYFNDGLTKVFSTYINGNLTSSGYTSAANQSTKNLDINGLSDIYKTQGQDAYRSELSKRLSTTLTEAGLSGNLEGSLFTGDARFDEGASAETLKNISKSLFQLSSQTGTDYSASKLSKILSDASGAGLYTKDVTSYFNPDQAYLTTALDKLDKTATTLTNEATAAAQAAAERDALIAKEKSDAQAKADAEIAAVKLGQATAIKKTQLLKRNTGGGTEGLSLYRQLATVGPGGGLIDDAQGKSNNLGSATTYGK